jgi:hypothetical protein
MQIRSSRLGGTFLAAIVILTFAGDLAGQHRIPTEYQVKAAYLSNFGRFVEWPQGAAAPETQSFNICVLGEDPFGPVLDAALAGERIDQVPLAARRIATVRDAAPCRILFISASAEKQLKDILSSLGKIGVLTVSDIPEFARHGGMIQLVLRGNRVRFEVNLTAVEQVGLSLRSELLKLAVAIRRTP